MTPGSLPYPRSLGLPRDSPVSPTPTPAAAGFYSFSWPTGSLSCLSPHLMWIPISLLLPYHPPPSFLPPSASCDLFISPSECYSSILASSLASSIQNRHMFLLLHHRYRNWEREQAFVRAGIHMETELLRRLHPLFDLFLTAYSSLPTTPSPASMWWVTRQCVSNAISFSWARKDQSPLHCCPSPLVHPLWITVLLSGICSQCELAVSVLWELDSCSVTRLSLW